VIRCLEELAFDTNAGYNIVRTKREASNDKQDVAAINGHGEI